MVSFAEKLLYLAVVLFVVGVLTRLLGFHQAKGILEGTLPVGITPRGFMDAAMTCGVFSIAFAVVGVAKCKMGSCSAAPQNEDNSDQNPS